MADAAASTKPSEKAMATSPHMSMNAISGSVRKTTRKTVTAARSGPGRAAARVSRKAKAAPATSSSTSARAVFQYGIGIRSRVTAFTRVITGRPAASPLNPGCTTRRPSSTESEALTSATPCARTAARAATAMGHR